MFKKKIRSGSAQPLPHHVAEDLRQNADTGFEPTSM